MDRGKVSFVDDAFKYGPKKALSLLNSKLRNDKTISTYLANKKYDKLAGVARALGYGKKKRKVRRGGSNPFAQLINPRNWEIVGSIGKSVISDVIAPVVTGKIPNPFDMAKIVYDGVKKVNGKGKRKGMRKIRVVGGRIDTPYNKGLLM